jgi:putative two-component system response regulator
MKILVVDDDVVVQKLLAARLQEGGHDVVIASSGLEAMERLKGEPLRMVITDWMMPGMDGIELCRWIRTGLASPYVYVIVLSSRNQTTDVIDGLNAGADEFLSKPVDPGELAARVRAGMRVLNLESRQVAIFGMAKLAESRDPETGQHLERIRAYARILAQKYGLGTASALSADDIETIYLTSPLHDIGKVGIPDSILLKAGRLNDEEFEVMKTHTLIGGETLGAAAKQYPDIGFLKMARDIALLHHEHFDGKGYPYGLKGTEIPLAARIATLADVYDALTSRRVYKTALTHQVARGIIYSEKGGHFDPAVVDAFRDGEEEFRAVYTRLQDAAR